MDKDIGYVLEPLVNEIPLSNSVKCRLKSDAPPFILIPNRRSIDVFSLCRSGIDPQYSIPFGKDIMHICSIPSRAIPGSNRIDSVIVFFYDCSFIVFNDPKNVLFRYEPKEYKGFRDILVDVHYHQSLLLFYREFGILKLWDASLQRQNNVFDIRIEDFDVVEVKFLKTKVLSICVLYSLPNGSKRTIVSSLDLSTLVLTQMDSLSINELNDPTTSMIIPLPQGDSDKPYYLTIGSERICSVFINNVSSIEAPIKKGAVPTAYCQIAGSLHMISDDSGSLYLLDHAKDVKIACVGDVKTIPTSLLHIDGPFFYVGSTESNSFIISIDDGNVRVLNVFDHFSPVNSFSSLHEISESLILTQGRRYGYSNLTCFKTGSLFNEEIVIESKKIDKLFTSSSKYLVLSSNNQTSHILSFHENIFDCIKIPNFRSDLETIGILEIDDENFIQITPNSAIICGVLKGRIKFDSDIIDTSCDKNFIVLFSNMAEVLSPQLDLLYQIIYETCPYKCVIFGNIVVIAFWNGRVSIFNNETLISYMDFPQEDYIIGLHLVRSVQLLLFVIFQDGKVYIFSVGEKKIIDSLLIGYYISCSFLYDSDSVIIIGSSPSLLSVNGKVIPIIMNSFSMGIKMPNHRIGLLSEYGIAFGTIIESNISTHESEPINGIPLMISVHSQPLTVFVSVFENNQFFVKGYFYPSNSLAFETQFKSEEEITFLDTMNSIDTTFIGTICNSSGKLYAIRQSFGSFKIVSELELEGGVFCMLPLDSSLIVGGRNKLYHIKVSISLSGFFQWDISQTIPAPSITKSLGIVRNYLIQFDSFRSISLFKHDDNLIFEKAFDYFVPQKTHSGFISSEIKPGVYHLFVSTLDGSLIIYSLQFDPIRIKKLTSIVLSSPITMASPIHDGFYVVSQRNGSFSLLFELNKEEIRVLQKIGQELSKNFLSPVNESKIAQMSYLNLFKSIPGPMQLSICQSIGVEYAKVIQIFEKVKTKVAQICTSL